MAEIRVLHPDERETEIASGSMTRIAGVSKNLCGAKGIHPAVATIPSGCQSSAHHHANCGSAIYIIRGHGRFLVGDRLEKALPFGPGDFIYVPPYAPHRPVNDSLAEPVEMVVARNAPVEIVEEHRVKVARGS